MPQQDKGRRRKKNPDKKTLLMMKFEIIGILIVLISNHVTVVLHICCRRIKFSIRVKWKLKPFGLCTILMHNSAITDNMDPNMMQSLTIPLIVCTRQFD